MHSALPPYYISLLPFTCCDLAPTLFVYSVMDNGDGSVQVMKALSRDEDI